MSECSKGADHNPDNLVMSDSIMGKNMLSISLRKDVPADNWLICSGITADRTGMKVWILFLCLLLFSGTIVSISCASGADSPPDSILLMRLSYFGPERGQGMAKEISSRLSSRFRDLGYKVIVPSEGIHPFSFDAVKGLADRYHADYAIYGSVNQLGRIVTINVRVLDTQDVKPGPKMFVAQGTVSNIEDMLGHVTGDIKNLLSVRDKVYKVRVQGNKRVDTDAILQNITTRKGELYSPKKISSDVKAVYGMGFFDDVRVDVEDSPSGKIVTFLLREKPAIRKIRFTGNKEIKDEKIKEVLDLKPFTVISEKALQENAEKIKALYSDKGFVGTTVVPTLLPVSSQAADVVFKINEGEKVRIASIKFQGNRAFSDSELEGLMETREKRPFWDLSIRNIVAMIKGERGVLKWDALERDLGRITAFYHNQGYVDARVGRPMVKRKGAKLYITIPIEEGERYRVGNVGIEEDFFKNKEKLLEGLEITKEKYFNQQVLRQDIMKLNDMYADKGFAYADIVPDLKEDKKKRVVDIVFKVNRGPKVTFERIEISGNTRTRDKVIRRELRVNELEPFSASGLRTSSKRLRRLGYFQDVNLTPTRGSDKKHMKLNVTVKERPTGTFSIGAGYSSVDKLMLMGEISQRNFLGKGQSLSFKGVLGSQTNRFSLSFTEPYFRDTRLSLGTDIYNWEQEYDDYTKDSTGGSLRFGYPLTDNLNTFLGVRIDNTTLSSYASNSTIARDADIHTTRSVSVGLSYDTRNDFYLPSRGLNTSISMEYAGGVLGGDSAYIKLEGVASYYHPIWKQIVGHGRLGLGYVTEGNNGKLPIYERFFLGGIDSVRGFKYGRISPVDDTGERIGGDVMGYLQMETIFPLIKNMGLNGVCFLDMGDVWKRLDDIDLANTRKSVGFGIRWLSPMGPLRIEWGYNIDKQKGDDNSNWEFRMGGTF